MVNQQWKNQRPYTYLQKKFCKGFKQSEEYWTSGCTHCLRGQWMHDDLFQARSLNALQKRSTSETLICCLSRHNITSDNCWRETSKQARLTWYIYTYDTNCSENKAEDNKIIQMAQFSRIFGIQVNLIKIKRLTCDLVCWAWILPSRHCHHS